MTPGLAIRRNAHFTASSEHQLQPATISTVVKIAREQMTYTARHEQTRRSCQKTASFLNTHTVKGELARSDRPATASGGEQYIVRDPQNQEVPIDLSPQSSNQVQVDDMVEAQLDSEGRVTSISKAQ